MCFQNASCELVEVHIFITVPGGFGGMFESLMKRSFSIVVSSGKPTLYGMSGTLSASRNVKMSWLNELEEY